MPMPMPVHNLIPMPMPILILHSLLKRLEGIHPKSVRISTSRQLSPPRGGGSPFSSLFAFVLVCLVSPCLTSCCLFVLLTLAPFLFLFLFYLFSLLSAMYTTQLPVPTPIPIDRSIDRSIPIQQLISPSLVLSSFRVLHESLRRQVSSTPAPPLVPSSAQLPTSCKLCSGSR